jgi:hypothetical protein
MTLIQLLALALRLVRPGREETLSGGLVSEAGHH